MTVSTRSAILGALMIAAVAVYAHAQSTPSKESTASISGKVTVAGEAVQGVVVTLRSGDPSSTQKLINARGVTDAKGQYRISNVAPGSYTVVPAAAALVGEDDGERTVIVNGTEAIENIDFSLIHGGVITGRVVDSDGKPVIEADVFVFSPRNPRGAPFRPSAITDDRGIYRVFALRPGSYTVAAGRNDMLGNTGRRPNGGGRYLRTYYPGSTDEAQATAVKVSDGSEATNIDITLARMLTTHTASGRVVSGDTGEPVADANFGVTQFISPTRTNSVNQGSVTNSRGEFKLEDLMPGQYAISVRPKEGGDWRAEDVRFEIVDQDLSGIIIKTIKGGSVSGVVVLDGPSDNAIREQLREAKVVVFVATENSRHGGVLGVTGAVRPDGSFRVGGLGTGSATFSLSASPRFRILRIERDGVIQSGSMDLRQGDDVTGLRIVVGFGDGSIRGTLEIENGTLPPNGQFFVWARRVNDSSSEFRAAQPDARGQFVFEYLFPGTYELAAGVLVQGVRTPLVTRKQQIVVAAGSASNTSIKLDLNPPKP